MQKRLFDNFNPRLTTNKERQVKSFKLTIAKMLILWVACIFGLVYTVASVVESHGGIKQILIDTGKEIKEISEEIQKD